MGNVKSINTKKVIRDVLYAFLAQALSLFLSILLSLIIPKFLDFEGYGYWQLFLFYIGYVGIFHLGYIDGVYLRMGGKQYYDLGFCVLGKELRILTIMQIIISMIIVAFSWLFVTDSNRSFIIAMTALYLPAMNLSNYFGYIFQAVNRTQLYSISVMIDKLFVLLGVMALLIFRAENVIPYIVIYVLSKYICLLYCMWNGKELLTHSCKINISIWKDYLENISVGIKLMISNLVGMLVLGVGRMIIDEIWGIETFGKFSMSISLINFSLQFIEQISMVMFPTLRVINQDRLYDVFKIGQRYLGVILSFAMIFYFPIRWFMYYWLPDYYDSMIYLALLMPICIFDGKMNVLCTTYFKVLREEKKLLLINVASLVCSCLLSFLGGYLFNSMIVIVLGMVLTIMLRCVISEFILGKVMHIKISKNTCWEIVLSGVFMIGSYVLEFKQGAFLYCAFYILYFSRNYKFLKILLHRD